VKATVIVTLKDKSGKEKVKRLVKDLGTNNLGRFLAALLTPASVAGKITCTLKDVNGTDRTFNIMWTGANASYLFNLTNQGSLRQIKVGNNNTAPSKTDYNLKGNILGTSNVTVYWSDNGDYVDLTAEFTWTRDVTVYEIGLLVQMSTDINTVYEILFDRTVVSDGIPVTAGRVLSITYRFQIA